MTGDDVAVEINGDNRFFLSRLDVVVRPVIKEALTRGESKIVPILFPFDLFSFLFIIICFFLNIVCSIFVFLF